MKRTQPPSPTFVPNKRVQRVESTLSHTTANRLLSISNFTSEDIPVGEKIHGRYEIDQFLGKGGFAKVIVAVDQMHHRKVAIKIGTAKVNSIINIMRREIAALREVNHPNIIQAYDFYQDTSLCCIVMELVEGGELFDRIKENSQRYTEKKAQEVAKTLLSAMAHMHSKGVVHRDLKPDNLVMVSANDDLNLKIIDFGVAAINTTEMTLHGKCGTAYYMAPEILKGELYGSAVDIWSFGVIMYILLFGYLPFAGTSREDLEQRILSGQVQFPKGSPVTTEARSFIHALLRLNPMERLSANEALGHGWLYSRMIAEVDLSETQKQLRRFQMKRKLRKYFFVILACVLFRRAVVQSRQMIDSPLKPSAEEGKPDHTPSIQSMFLS